MARRRHAADRGAIAMLSASVSYAARALTCVAQAEGGSLLIREIAKRSGVPGAYLAKIVGVLARKGFVVTQRGIGGGVAPARDLEAVSLYDLCLALDDPIVQTRCLLDQTTCSDERACPAHEFWVEHRDKEIEFLKRTTIRHMAAFEAKQERNAEGVLPTNEGSPPESNQER